MSTSSKGSIERWVDVARKQERLSANRWDEISLGKPYKEKRKTLRRYDNRIKSAIRKHKNGTFTLRQYWDEILRLKQDYAMKHIYT